MISSLILPRVNTFSITDHKRSFTSFNLKLLDSFDQLRKCIIIISMEVKSAEMKSSHAFKFLIPENMHIS